MLLFRVASLSVLACLLSAPVRAEAPSKQTIYNAMKESWEQDGTSGPRATLTINSVKYGGAHKATLQQVQVEGFPAGSMVYPALIDFTVHTYYTGETQGLERVRECEVYKNKFNEWAVQIGSARGEDKRTVEAAAPR